MEVFSHTDGLVKHIVSLMFTFPHCEWYLIHGMIQRDGLLTTHRLAKPLFNVHGLHSKIFFSSDIFIQSKNLQSNPIQDATDPTIACNDDGTSGALQLTATVAAGTPITAYWNQGNLLIVDSRKYRLTSGSTQSGLTPKALWQVR